MTNFGEVNNSTPLTDQIVLGITNFRKGVTAPVDSTLGTTPTTPTVLFANINELLTIGTTMPSNWDRTVDATLILFWSLAAVETNGDTWDIDCNYTVPLVNSGGSGPGKASTLVQGTITAVTGQLAIGDSYEMSLAIPSADATNPFTSTDAFGFVLEIGPTNLTGVASCHFIGACIVYERLR